MAFLVIRGSKFHVRWREENFQRSRSFSDRRNAERFRDALTLAEPTLKHFSPGATSAPLGTCRPFEISYLSTIENHWMNCQGAALRFSPLDWAYVAAWEDAGIPLEAVLLGMTRAFQSFRPTLSSRRIRSVSYCSQSVAESAATLVKDSTAGHGELRRALRREFLGERS
ncbi:MAG: hypothetical protein ABSA41_12475 [Terriglobia bacterium]|jgi:hypothetical protein